MGSESLIGAPSESMDSDPMVGPMAGVPRGHRSCTVALPSDSAPPHGQQGRVIGGGLTCEMARHRIRNPLRQSGGTLRRRREERIQSRGQSPCRPSNKGVHPIKGSESMSSKWVKDSDPLIGPLDRVKDSDPLIVGLPKGRRERVAACQLLRGDEQLVMDRGEAARAIPPRIPMQRILR